MNRHGKILSLLPGLALLLLVLAGPATVLSPIVAPAQAAVTVAAAHADGVIKQRSDYAFDETVARLKGDIAAKGTADLQAADDVAAAVDADTGKMADPIAHACYPALIKFIGGLPKSPSDGSAPGPAVVFERARLARKMIQAGLPDSLKIGCAPLVQDEAGFFVKILALAGVTVCTGGLAGLAIPAVPGLLSALPLVP